MENIVINLKSTRRENVKSRSLSDLNNNKPLKLLYDDIIRGQDNVKILFENDSIKQKGLNLLTVVLFLLAIIVDVLELLIDNFDLKYFAVINLFVMTIGIFVKGIDFVKGYHLRMIVLANAKNDYDSILGSIERNCDKKKGKDKEYIKRINLKKLETEKSIYISEEKMV
jgi:hypothetical protein